MLGSRLINSVAKRVWGIFSVLRNLFTKESRSIENDLNERERIIIYERDQLKRTPNVPAYINDRLDQQQEQLNKDREEFYQVINLIKALPSGGSRFFYFESLIKILSSAGRAEEVLDEGKIYTFKYIAKTPGKWYDLHPVSLIVESTGNRLSGINYHWENQPQYLESPFRTYLRSRIITDAYRIERHELEAVLNLDTFYPMFIPKGR
jgi:hypothetical protein